MKQKRSVFVIATIMTLVTGTFYAQSTMAEDNDDKDAWQFEITPYLFAAGMNGTLGARGVESDLDMSFNDIWDRLDKAFMMLLRRKAIGFSRLMVCISIWRMKKRLPGRGCLGTRIRRN